MTNTTVLHHQELCPSPCTPVEPQVCPSSPLPPCPSPCAAIPLAPALDTGLQLRLLFPAHHQHVVSRVINLHCDETQPDVRVREATGEAACLAQPPPPEPAAR